MAMAMAMAMAMVDWTQLPLDLLLLIADRFTEIPDLLRSRAVCTKWRSSIPIPIPIPKTLIQQLPWLLLPSKPKSDSYIKGEDGTLRFFSLSENRTYVIPFPELRYRRIIASTHAHGWLVALSPRGCELDVDGSDDFIIHYRISLVNPLTCRSIPLPPMLLPRGFIPNSDPPDSPHKLKHFGSSSGDESDLVVAYGNPNWAGILFCRPGETTWTKIEAPGYKDCNCDFIIHNRWRRLFLFNWTTQRTQIFDMTTLEMVSDTKTSLPLLSCKFVESQTGELLALFDGVGGFKVLQLDESDCVDLEQPLKWGLASSIGDCAVLIGRRMYLASNGFQGCKRNCIYIVALVATTDSELNADGVLDELGSAVGVFDIGKYCFEKDTLILDGLDKEWCSAEWFKPSL